MKNLLIISFLAMIVYAIFFRLILVDSYAALEEFERCEEGLRSHRLMMRRIMFVMDFFGGHRVVVGFLGLVGMVLIVIL